MRFVFLALLGCSVELEAPPEARGALERAGVEVQVRGGALQVDPSQHAAAVEIVAALGLTREAETPRLVVGPAEQRARDRRRVAREVEGMLRARPCVVAAQVVLSAASAAVDLLTQGACDPVEPLVRAAAGLPPEAPIVVQMRAWEPPVVPPARGPRVALAAGLGVLGVAGLGFIVWRRAA